ELVHAASPAPDTGPAATGSNGAQRGGRRNPTTGSRWGSGWAPSCRGSGGESSSSRRKPLYGSGSQCRRAVAKSTLLLNTSRDGDSTTSLGSPFQRLITRSVKKCFLISSLNLPLCNLKAIPSCSITCYLVKETHPQFSATSFQVV
ncbi:unnamed protein product, partial [Bubo scandiacus]